MKSSDSAGRNFAASVEVKLNCVADFALAVCGLSREICKKCQKKIDVPCEAEFRYIQGWEVRRGKWEHANAGRALPKSKALPVFKN